VGGKALEAKRVPKSSFSRHAARVANGKYSGSVCNRFRAGAGSGGALFKPLMSRTGEYTLDLAVCFQEGRSGA